MNPFLFVVGRPALRHADAWPSYLDGHPEIAVVHEARFVPGWFVHRRGVTRGGFTTPELVERLVEFERFEHLDVTREQLERLIATGEPVPYTTFVSELFDLHGRARGKRLVADKSPRYVRNIPTLHELPSDTKVLHLLRDGRDVALSVASWKKVHGARRPHRSRGDLAGRSPSSTIALWWEHEVQARTRGRPRARTGPLRRDELRGGGSGPLRRVRAALRLPRH